MAKKYKFRRIIENIVSFGYDRGVWQSMIIHSIIFLILALTFQTLPLNKRPLALEISFNTLEILEIEDTSPITIENMVASYSAENSSEEIQDIPVVEEGMSLDIKVEDIVTDQTESISDSYNDISKIDLTEEISGIPETTESIEIIEPTVIPEPDIVVSENKPKPKVKLPKSPKQKKQYTTAKNTTPKIKGLLGHDSLLGPGNGQSPGTGQQDIGVQNEQMRGEVNKRLFAYGAKTGDVQISLAWNTIDDLDLHVAVEPLGSRINWMSRVSRCGGMLDIDMNANPGLVNNRPIENIFWEYNTAPFNVEYTVGVHYYRSWSGARTVNGVIQIKVDNKTQMFPVSVTLGQPVVIITTFKR